MSEHLITLRRTLHQFPELSGEEKETAEKISSFCSKLKNAEILIGIGGHGIAVVFHYSNEGPVVLLRCELDALPIEEENDFSYKSIVDGKSHKCGHEGHMTILCGLGEWLDENSFLNGKVILLFQPAEENGEGAIGVINDKQFIDKLQPDYAFALHNLPGFDMHEVVVVDGVFTPDVRSFGIYLKGLQSHASEPEKGINPAKCLAELILELDQLIIPDVDDSNFALLTPVYSKLGSPAYGISSGDGELHYTIRTADNNTMDKLINNIENCIERLSKKYQLKSNIQWFEHFPLTINNSFCNEKVLMAAEKNDFKILRQDKFFRFGEDFGWISQKYPSAFFGIGAGMDTPPLHNPRYDFPDELIGTGIKMFKGILKEILD